MTDRVRSLLLELTPEERDRVLQELLTTVLATLDGERAILDSNGNLLGYLLPVADRLRLEARTVESREVFERESGPDEPRYTTREVLARLQAGE